VHPGPVSLVASLASLGIALILCGNAAALAWRKQGITVGAFLSAGSTAAAHPERYVRPDRVRIVRVLFVTGVGFVLASVVVLVALTIRHPR
jgi:hypothetical protein